MRTTHGINSQNINENSKVKNVYSITLHMLKGEKEEREGEAEGEKEGAGKRRKRGR